MLARVVKYNIINSKITNQKKKIDNLQYFFKINSFFYKFKKLKFNFFIH